MFRFAVISAELEERFIMNLSQMRVNAKMVNNCVKIDSAKAAFPTRNFNRVKVRGL